MMSEFKTIPRTLETVFMRKKKLFRKTDHLEVFTEIENVWTGTLKELWHGVLWKMSDYICRHSFAVIHRAMTWEGWDSWIVHVYSLLVSDFSLLWVSVGSCKYHIWDLRTFNGRIHRKNHSLTFLLSREGWLSLQSFSSIQWSITCMQRNTMLSCCHCYIWYEKQPFMLM